MEKFIACIAIFAVAACTPQAPRSGDIPVELPTSHLIAQTRGTGDLVSVNSVLVLPVQSSEKLRSISSDALLVNQALVSAIMDEVDLQLVASKEVLDKIQAAYPRIDGSNLSEIGKKYHADAVLVTKLTEYTERLGSSIGVTEPAQVDFSMELVRVSDSKSVWSATYHFKDQALSENLFNVKDKLSSQHPKGWRTAKDLLIDGFHSAARDFASKRTSQFMGDGATAGS